jgi:hypothetical protein
MCVFLWGELWASYGRGVGELWAGCGAIWGDEDVLADEFTGCFALGVSVFGAAVGTVGGGVGAGSVGGIFVADAVGYDCCGLLVECSFPRCLVFGTVVG